MKTDRHIDIMGIVNITDDSYFAQSRCVDVRSALSRVCRMLDDGADIIDIGACSTRPGSASVGEDEEWRRLEPVLMAIKETCPDVRLSIDTYWSSVVTKAHALIGDFIVNDISAGEDDPLMLPTVGELGLTYVAMHKRGNPQTMQQMTRYDDVVEDVRSYFEDFSVKAASYGVKDWILDPGITTLADGFWFGFILVTTIGFGDFTVTTLPARIVAGILGLYGDLVITFLTGAITSWFFEKFQAFRGHSVGAFVTQLEHMDELSDEELQQVADKAKALRAQKEAGKQTSA